MLSSERPQLPVLIRLGLHLRDDARRLLLDACDYLEKLFAFDDLVARVRRHAWRRAERELQRSFGVSRAARALAVAAGVAFGTALIVDYIVSYLMVSPPVVAATGSEPRVHLTLQTVASFGNPPHPDWVWYLARDPSGNDPLHGLACPAVLDGGCHHLPVRHGHRAAQPVLVAGAGHRRRHHDGRWQAHEGAATGRRVTHVRDLGPQRQRAAQGRRGRRQEPVQRHARARSRRRTPPITFVFRTGKRGTFRWQCFVPCAAEFHLRLRRPDAVARLDGRLPEVV